MNTRITLILVCLVLVLAGSIMLVAKTLAQQAFLLENTAMHASDEPLLPPSTVPPIGPYSEYMPLIQDTVSTPTIQPMLTATLEVEPTGTVAPATPPGTDTPTPLPGSTATFTPTASATVPPDATPTAFLTATIATP